MSVLHTHGVVVGVDDRPLLSRQVIQGEAGEVLRRAAQDAAYPASKRSRRPRRTISWLSRKILIGLSAEDTCFPYTRGCLPTASRTA